MLSKKDDFKTFIVIVVVCVICLVIGILISFKSNTDKLIIVNEYNVFFSNVNYINDYISSIANGDSKTVYELLDNDYIENNSITVFNVLDYVQSYSLLDSFEASIMYYVEVNNDYIYYIKGSIYEITYDGSKLVDDNFSMLIVMDTSTKSYSLYPVNDDNYEKVINGIWRVSVKNNEFNNVINSENVSMEQVCVVYLSDFINSMFEDIDGSYDLLSEDMKKVYTSSNSYKNYINDNFSLFSTLADKCRMDEVDGKRVYTVIDNNKNTYVFTENSIMNYKVSFYLEESE